MQIELAPGVFVRQLSESYLGRSSRNLRVTGPSATELTLRFHHGLLVRVDLRRRNQPTIGGRPAGELREAVIAAAATWTGTCTVLEVRDPGGALGDDESLDLATREILLAAARSLAEPDTLRAVLGDGDRPFQRSSQYTARAQGLELDEVERALLASLGEPSSGSALCAGQPDDVAARRGLAALVAVGIVEQRGQPRGEAASVARSNVVDDTDIANAESAMVVNQMLRRARQLLNEDRRGEAARMLEELIPEIESPVLQRKARVLLADVHARTPHLRKRAEEALRAVLRDDPRHIDALYSLGLLYQSDGQPGRAEETWRKLLAVQPNHAGALAQLKSLGSTAPGLLRRLFGKS